MTIRSLASQGNPLTQYCVIDAHAHLGHCPSVHAAHADAAGILGSMDQIGIQITCISAFQALGGDYHQGNDHVARTVARHPGRFLGYGVINPNYPDDLEAELHRCLDTLGLFAIKMHPVWHAYPPDGPAYHRVYAAMQVRQGIVLSHTFGEPRTLERLAAGYPDVTFIVAHVAGTYDPALAESYAILMEARPNVFLDTVLSRVYYRDIEQWVAVVGASRLVFGSDVPFNDNAHQIGRITHADLSEEDKQMILGGTMARILARVGYDVSHCPERPPQDDMGG